MAIGPSEVWLRVFLSNAQFHLLNLMQLNKIPLQNEQSD